MDLKLLRIANITVTMLILGVGLYYLSAKYNTPAVNFMFIMTVLIVSIVAFFEEVLFLGNRKPKVGRHE